MRLRITNSLTKEGDMMSWAERVTLRQDERGFPAKVFVLAPMLLFERHIRHHDLRIGAI
jgi:hypothetical protein